ncbi:response regulator [Vibrio astriarenae]
MDAIRKVYQYAQPNLTLISWMGMLGFPLYYIVWEYLFPQPYENLPLRLFCSVFFALVLFRDQLPVRLKQYNDVIYQVAITLGLPFFFFFMLLMNDWSYVWVMSYMSATFLHILLVHMTRVVFAQAIVALSSAVLFAWIAKGYQFDMMVDWAHLPIFLFVYVFGNLCYSQNQDEHETKTSLAKSFGAGIAHEMRNPLSCLCSSIDVIQSTLPKPSDDDNERYSLSKEDLSMLRGVSDEAMKIIYAGNDTIDLLLTSIDENRVSRATFKRHSAHEVIAGAVESFSYKGRFEKRSIHLALKNDFQFLGSDTLLKYVMYNLFKNAFDHRKVEALRIDVTIEAGAQGHRIIVKDNGNGIAPDVLKNIYQDFYTAGKSGSYGLGLPFCRKVMKSFGGKIHCISELGKGATFTLSLPSLDSDASRNIMKDITSLKSILTISDRPLISTRAWLLAARLGFKPQTITFDEALKRQEHEFEYDLVFIDLDSPSLSKQDMITLKRLLEFTEARIVLLYQADDNAHIKIQFANQVFVKESEWQDAPDQLLENLLFDSGFVATVPHAKPVEMTGKRTVMLVDDNTSVRKLTRLLLEKQGFSVIEKENGQQVIESFGLHHVDMILMDIEMPVLDGIEATKQIRASNHANSLVPIIAHTGDSSQTTLDKIENAGMNDYIVKPANVARLFDKLSHWA